MRWRLALLAVVLGAAFWLTAPQPDTAQTSGAPADPATPCAYSVGDLHAAVKQVYGFGRWHHPPKPAARRIVAAMGRCVPGGPAYVRRARDKFRVHVAYRSVTPFRGLDGEGYWLKWLATPAWVVKAETSRCNQWEGTRRGGQCRWSIRNPSSGACGPYQELDHIPCDSPPLAHHRLAHSLPRGSWEVGY